MARVRIDLPESFHYTTGFTVRITDLNYGGHVGNDTILSYCHEARARFFADKHLSELDIGGLGLIVADAAVVYRAESFFADYIKIRIAAREFNKYGCDMVYRLDRVSDGKEIARAKTGLVFFDYDQRQIAQSPGIFRSLFPNTE